VNFKRKDLRRAAVCLGLIALAIGLALAPLPRTAVERWYSTAVFPLLQGVLTRASNVVPFALFDVAILVLIGAGVWLFARDLRARTRWSTLLGRWGLRLATTAAVVYIAFALIWGLNYRRVPLAGRFRQDEAAVSLEGVARLAQIAVDQLNTHYHAAHAAEASGGSSVDPSLAASFERALHLIGLEHRAVPGRPKRSLLDPYFRAASVAGMTNPFFLETLIVSDLMPVERPMVIAHEWSHLAGINDEGEANFVAWLTGVHGTPAAQYSAWLFMYEQALSSLRRDQRGEVARRLEPGPREDLRAIAARQRRNVRPAVANTGWRVYDQYLKANRVPSGAASYAEVVRIVLQTRFEGDWKPVLATTKSP
jgi:hypothetical protein